MHKFDVIIVGAGFAGISCAKILAQNGINVAVLERKKDIEQGIHTTGILVNEAADLLNIPEELCKKINQVRLYSPSLKFFEIKSDDYIFLATDTPKMMSYLVEDAKKSGVQFFLGTSFKDARIENEIVYINGNDFESRFVIGADGAKSKVAEVFNLGKNKKFLVGTEYEYSGVRIKNDNAFYCFLNRKYARGYIGWVIPGPKVTQIGLAKLPEKEKNKRADIEGFMEYIKDELDFDGSELVEKRGGLIPINGLVKPFYNENVILVGDAAGIVSPLTAGGIHTALFYGNRLGELLANHINNKAAHPGDILLKEYPRFFHKHIYRTIFNNLPDFVFEIMVRFPGFRWIANMMFFLKKRLPKTRLGN